MIGEGSLNGVEECPPCPCLLPLSVDLRLQVVQIATPREVVTQEELRGARETRRAANEQVMMVQSTYNLRLFRTEYTSPHTGAGCQHRARQSAF